MQVEYKTEKGTVYFYKVPDNTESVQLVDKDSMKSFLLICLTGTLLPTYIGVEEGLTLIGLTSEVTEDQAKMMVDEFKYTKNVTFRKNYPRPEWTNITANESFKSLMQHLHVYDSIPERGQIIEERTGKWIVLFKPNEK